ncbi:hypothetical protein CBL_12368 [Carabus blaptoides fortunei]
MFWAQREAKKTVAEIGAGATPTSADGHAQTKRLKLFVRFVRQFSESLAFVRLGAEHRGVTKCRIQADIRQQCAENVLNPAARLENNVAGSHEFSEMVYLLDTNSNPRARDVFSARYSARGNSKPGKWFHAQQDGVLRRLFDNARMDEVIKLKCVATIVQIEHVASIIEVSTYPEGSFSIEDYA